MMKKQNIRNKTELTEFLDRPFVIDLLYPIYDEKSVDTVFKGWIGQKKNSWYEFTNLDGDILEFYPEGTYIIRRGAQSNDSYQLRTPKTIEQFVEDMGNACIQIDFV